MDVNAIEPGRDFRKTIDESVSECSVLLAVIGPDWLNSKDKLGNRRLDDDNDFVRLEISSALRRNIPVIPVLVRAATVPTADQLKPDLSDLAFRNAVELTHARWKSDVLALIHTLEPYAGSSDGAAPSPIPPRRYLISALAIGIIAVFAILLVPKFLHRNQLPDTSKPNVLEATSLGSTGSPKPNGNPPENLSKPEAHLDKADSTRTPQQVAPSQTSAPPPANLGSVTIIHSSDFDEDTLTVDDKRATQFIASSTINSTLLKLPAGPHTLKAKVAGKPCRKSLIVTANEVISFVCSVSEGGSPE